MPSVRAKEASSSFQSGVKSQFLQRVVDVALDRMDRDMKFVGNLFVAHSPRNEIDYFVFAPGQLDSFHKTIGFPALDCVFHYVRE
jgi:hypothetical protein